MKQSPSRGPTQIHADSGVNSADKQASSSLSEARRHIALLTGSPDTQMRFRLIHERDRGQPATVLEGDVDANWPAIVEHQSRGYGVFVVVNEGGDTDAEITGVRAVFVDGDNIPQPAAWHVEPDLLCVRDPTHWHAYWLVTDVQPGDFRSIQARLAAQYGSDPRVVNPSRVMRLAGTLHQKDEAHRPVICVVDRADKAKRYGLPLSADEVLVGLPAAPTRKRESVASPTGIELDEQGNVARAEYFLKNARPAVEGEGGDNQTYIVACETLNYGVSEEKALELIETVYNPRCIPPWDTEDLETKIRNAASYAQNEVGAWAVEPATATFGDALAGVLPAPSADTAKRPRVVLHDEAMQDTWRPIEWLVDSILPEVGAAAIHAQYDSYKSFVATDLALAVASGRPAFNKFRVTKPGPAIYLLGEGAHNFGAKRRKAWREGRGIPADESLPIYAVKGVPQVRSEDDVAAYVEAIDQLREPPRLIVLDTLSRAMAGLNENDPGDAGLFLDMAEGLAQRYNCCVLTIAHEGKDAGRGMRGSSAFPAGFEIVWQMEANQNAWTAKLVADKVKDDAPPPPIHLQGREVLLPAGKKSMVFDWVDSDDHQRATTGRGGITNSDVRAALIKLGAVNGQTQTTRVLATELAGPDADENVVGAIEKALQRGSKPAKSGRDGRFAAHVELLGQGGRGDPTLWSYREPDRGPGSSDD